MAVGSGIDSFLVVIVSICYHRFLMSKDSCGVPVSERIT